MLSEEARACLKTLLPRSAFVGYEHTISDEHPSLEVLKAHPCGTDNGDDGTQDLLPDDVDHAFFIDAHFQAAMRTFQDHLQLNWLTDAHQDKLKSFQERIRNGTLAAPWKDEVWESDNCSALQVQNGSANLRSHQSVPNRPLRSYRSFR